MQLFRTGSSGTHDDIQQLLSAVVPCVTREMNDSLTREFTSDEIKTAVESIEDLKAPGPNGLLAIFFKKFWDVIGGILSIEALNVLRGGHMPAGWNDTIISLIPKINKPEKVTDLRPISLCNVVYKVVAKVLANRLKTILPDIIIPNQSAFVLGRLISGNILIAYELTEYLLKKTKGGTGYAAIKLDISKAYDRMEWEFLRKVMIRIPMCPTR